ncbi:MAG: glycosyltransferase family 2 protein [Sulfuritalea sp.]|nr:glycosyltransferase family 2 protein [Sulfuritalea sp.]
MQLTVVLVNYNTGHLLPRMFSALERAAAGVEMECILVDNASRDGSVDLLRREYAHHRLLANAANIGFARANNQALPAARGKYVLLLNTDAFVEPGTLKETLAFMDSRADCGILGVRLSGRDGSLQPSCRYFPTPLNVFLTKTGLGRFFPWVRMADDLRWDHASIRACDWVPGCYFLIRREVIEQVGLLDPRFFLYFEEVDYCRRAKQAGWKVVFYPHTTVVHLGGESARSDSDLTRDGQQISALQIESEILYFRKHYGCAGLFGHFLLAILADTILAAKDILRRRGTSAIGSNWRHVGATWSLLLATRWASRPTR